jgi:hypothetical protein
MNTKQEEYRLVPEEVHFFLEIVRQGIQVISKKILASSRKMCYFDRDPALL